MNPETTAGAAAELEPFIVCKRVVKAYRIADHEIVALRGVDFEMQRGEFVAIIGPSGAGKSSLLNLLGGLDTPTAGQLHVGGIDLLKLKGRALAGYRLQRVGFVWQNATQNLLPNRSALRNITLPMALAGVPPWKRRRRARRLLNAVGLMDKAGKRPALLSGGQQQRVGIAVALANQPDLLLADELTGALDRRTALQVMALIQELREEFGLTVLMVTHDLTLAAHADRVLTLRDGALGQDLSHPDSSTLDAAGRITLPEPVRGQFAGAARVAVEVRPEGVLLRPEVESEDDIGQALGEMLPQDAPPERRHLLGRLFRRQARKKR